MKETHLQKKKPHRPLFTFLLVALSACILLATTLLTAIAIFIYAHPEEFKVDLSLFAADHTGPSQLYYFSGGGLLSERRRCAEQVPFLLLYG